MCKRLAIVVVCMLVSMACKTPPPSSGRQAEIAFKSKCREDGAIFAAEWKTAHPSGYAAGGDGDLTAAGGWLALDQYAYSPQLNTCLWSGEYNGTQGLLGVWHVKLILDVYANKRLIEFDESNGKQVGEISEADFEKKKTELLGPK